ncbi:MAG: hypothetical protein K2J49_06120, partial [Muribaculaceae bacterium]|nr:hypothetical protein [Muribaculaceae bacterium]
MKPLSILIRFAPSLMLFTAVACGGSEAKEISILPPDFADAGDAGQVDYMMKSSTPDSVARFICNAALGKVENARIDTLSIAAAYAYENYNDSDLILFSREFD